MRDQERPGLKRAAVALQHRDFRLFYVALLVAGIGSQIQATANLIQIYDLTGSPLHLGLTGLARGVPIVVLSLVGGVIADRLDRRRLIVVTQALVGLFSIALAALTFGGVVEVWHIYLVTFLGSALTAVSAPARSALIPNLVPRHHLLNAIALNSTVWQASAIIGPAVAGVSVAAVGLPATYMANGTLHVLALGALTTMRVGQIAARSRGSAWNSVTEGVTFVRQHSIILALLATDTAAMLFGSFRALTPVFGERLGLGPEGVGLLFAAPGVGSILGSAAVMSMGDFRYKGLVIGGAILAFCASIGVLALSPWLILALVGAAGTGFFDSWQATPRNGVIQMITPDELRGRVSSFQHMLSGGTPAFGQALMGGVAALVGAPVGASVAAVAGAATCAVVICAIFAARPDLRARDLGEQHAPAALRVAEAQSLTG